MRASFVRLSVSRILFRQLTEMVIYLAPMLPSGSSGLVLVPRRATVSSCSLVRDFRIRGTSYLAADGVYHHVPSPARDPPEAELFTFPQHLFSHKLHSKLTRPKRRWVV